MYGPKVQRAQYKKKSVARPYAMYRRMWKIRAYQLNNVPHLVGVARHARPHLNLGRKLLEMDELEVKAGYLVAAGEAPIREVETLAHVGPRDPVIRSNGEMLVRVARSGRARPDL